MKTLKEALFSRKNINKGNELILKYEEDNYYLNILYVRFEKDQFEFIYEFENLNEKWDAAKTDPVYLELNIAKGLLEKLKTSESDEYDYKGKNRGTEILFNGFFNRLVVIDNNISKDFVTSFYLNINKSDNKKQLIQFLEKYI